MKKLTLIILFVSFFSSLNAQTEKNDSIKSNAETKEFIDPIYDTQQDVDPFISFRKLPTTPGDYLKLSGELGLLGYEITILTSVLYKVGVFNNISLNGQKTIFYTTGIVILGCFIASELNLIKAGKLMNEERVTLSPASEGIGLAINF